MKKLLLISLVLTFATQLFATQTLTKNSDLTCKVDEEVFYMDEYGEETGLFLEEDSINIAQGKVWYFDNDSETYLYQTESENSFKGFYIGDVISANFYMIDSDWQVDVLLYDITTTFYCY